MKKSIKESNLVILKNSSIHHKGIFAKKAIQAETKVLQYIGEKISKQEGTKRAIAAIEKESESKGGVYIFELNDKHDIDGDVPYNLAKYINHSCTPNCKILKEKGQIW
ncbi:MAG: SET domain-containing protein-lysine N-methyltransferase, partial [Candidatus Woesearchaeota archaeon]|nr:SET domain-containing protein-lysine N-methyltransferase [Candidatus Woesearchaeota archaeon]